MIDKKKEPEGTGLNPALRIRTDTTHDTSESTRPPADTASVHRGEEGRGWPIVWMVVTILCVLLALWIFFF